VPGEPFPAGTYSNMNAQAGGPAEIDLARYLGKKPLVLYYWIAGNTRSEQTFLELQQLVAEIGPEKLSLLGAAVPRPGIDVDKIALRMKQLGIEVPVLEDTEFQLGQRLRVSSVPNITVIDGEGRMRLTNGASLRQVLGYELDVAAAIRSTADSGRLLTHGYLAKYFPVRELEGEPCPDFTAPQIEDSVERRLHGLLDDSKVNVLIFWSVDCPHCRKSLPEINSWLREHPDDVNVISCASVRDEADKTKTKEFCKLNGFEFPTLVDVDSRVGDLYKVTTTPTIVIIGPDGVVDSTIISGYTDFGRTMEQKKKSLLGS
jgi:peroxiredoxin